MEKPEAPLQPRVISNRRYYGECQPSAAKFPFWLLLSLLLWAGLGSGCNGFNWTHSLHEALRPANRLRVRSGGTCHRQLQQEKTLLDLRNPDEITALIQNLQVDWKNCGFHCMCCGEPTLEFYQGEKLIASLGFHHAQSLRWLDGKWAGDAMLTQRSADYLVDWLASHGVSGPKEDAEDRRLQKEKNEISRAKWLAAMPKSLKPHWKSMQEYTAGPIPKKERMLAALNKEFPEVNQRIQALLGWYGSGAGPWSGYPSYEGFAEQLLLTYETPVLLLAIDQSPLSDAQTEGAARLLGGWTFSRQRPQDLPLLGPSLKQRLLEHSLKSGDNDKLHRANRAFGISREEMQGSGQSRH